MRVSFLMPCYPWGPMGGFRVVYEYANEFVARGHQVTIIHPRRVRHVQGLSRGTFGGQLRRKLKGLRGYICKPRIGWQEIDSRVRMLFVPNCDARYIPDADALFATAWHTTDYLLDYPASKGEKCYLIQGYEIWMGPRDLVERGWRLPFHKVVVSKWLRELGEGLGCKDLTYIPNAVDQKRYLLRNTIEDRPRQVAMMFSSVPWKGSRDGIAALEIAKKRYPDLKVVLFSTCRKKGWIPRWMEYYCNPSQEFIVDLIYNNSCVFLSSSRTEGFALPPAEAARCGCAVVATDSGGIREYIQNGVTGLLSAPQDPVALAENLCMLLEDENLRLRLATACRRTLESFTWERSATMLEEFLIDKIEQRRSVSPNELGVRELDVAPC